jgi:branched-chain amino acid transport system substrate-binding protein
LAKALRESGYKGIIAISYSDPGALIKVVGSGAEGVLLPNTVAEPQDPKQQELHDWYVKKYGPPAPGILYEMWDPLFVLVEAVKKANSFDPVKVAEAFRTVRWNSVFGPLYVGMESLYGLKCTFCRPIPMGIVRNGELKHLATLPWPSDEEIRKLNAD